MRADIGQGIGSREAAIRGEWVRNFIARKFPTQVGNWDQDNLAILLKTKKISHSILERRKNVAKHLLTLEIGSLV